MPLFGAHLSIAGGYHKALEAAAARAMDTVQLFTKNNNQWVGKPLGDGDVSAFQAAREDCEIAPLVAHDCYLINLASPDAALYRKSIEAFVDEVQRAERLGLDYLVSHPGAATDGDEAAGLQRVAAALNEVHDRCPGFHVQVLLETTAGQGTSLGHRFEHLADILGRLEQPGRAGVCVDTCHVFAAGYPLAPKAAYQKTWKEFDRVVGIDRVKVFHVNDSKKPLGSRVDRHEHIGKGALGEEPFRLLVNDRRFRKHPMILETPKEGPNDEDMDAANLNALREFVR